MVWLETFILFREILKDRCCAAFTAVCLHYKTLPSFHPLHDHPRRSCQGASLSTAADATNSMVVSTCDAISSTVMSCFWCLPTVLLALFTNQLMGSKRPNGVATLLLLFLWLLLLLLRVAGCGRPASCTPQPRLRSNRQGGGKQGASPLVAESKGGGKTVRRTYLR